MTPLESVILGVVEGITEFLPISSTGHLILASSVMGIAQTNFHKTFEIAIQFGAICSVIALYWRSFLNIEIIKKLFLAFLPTAAIGAMLYPFIKTYLLGNEPVVLISLFAGGVALIAFELLYKEQKDDKLAMAKDSSSLEQITYRQSFFVGVAQTISVIPGVSRSAATILGGLLLGIPRVAIVEFSFLLAVPTMFAATALDIWSTPTAITNAQLLSLTLGFVTAFIVALFSIKFLLEYVRKHTFIPFGIYRIIAAMLFFIILF